jgi:hypothetical protein
MNSINSTLIKDFISGKSVLLDGLIIKEENQLSNLKKLIENSPYAYCSYDNLGAFLKSTDILPGFCFINIDSCKIIKEKESLDLFLKTKGKTKLVLYNLHEKTLNKEELFTYINWMRLITIN